ncbi:MAG: hypothetical protein MUD06_13435, partial [Rhodospirillales bacterium]|nr:hypothetical protein [Rhodospirillales bacterium]
RVRSAGQPAQSSSFCPQPENPKQDLYPRTLKARPKLAKPKNAAEGRRPRALKMHDTLRLQLAK